MELAPLFMAIFFALVILWFVSALYCGEVAHQKGYKGAAWAIGGFFFGFFALVAAAGLPDRKLRKYIRLIGEKQNAIEVVKEKIEVVDGNTKISFSMPKDSSKEKIYKELVDLLKDGGCKLEEYNVTSYNLYDKLDKKFVVNSDEVDQLIVLYGKEKGNQINWSGRI